MIQANDAYVLSFRASTGRVANLTLRQTDNDGPFCSVDISHGRLDLEDCDIISQATSCVVIRDGADPKLRRNMIRGEDMGVYVRDGGLGTLEDNDITGNALSGVAITTGGNPTLSRNRINRNKCYAVWVHKGGRGVIENNDLRGNAGGAWDIAKECKANVTRTHNKE